MRERTAAQINGLGIVGVTANVAGNVLGVTAPTATAMGGSMVGALSGADQQIHLNTGGTVRLDDHWADGHGATASPSPPLPSTTMATYASDLTNALSAAGITNVTVTANATPDSCRSPAPMWSPEQPANFNFGANATVDPGSDLTIAANLLRRHCNYGAADFQF